MKKTLLTTSALAFAGAFAVGSASAADKMSVGLSGYMEQWIGMSAGNGDNGGTGIVSDSEFNVRGSLEADNGLKFSVKIEVEGNTSGDQIDESQATVSGSFGQVMLGSEDQVTMLMHHGHQDVGIGLNAGDVGTWLKGVSLGHTHGGFSDEERISYFTPRISGLQVGVSYTPDMSKGNEDSNAAPVGNDDDGWAIAANLEQNVGDASVKLSVGHSVKNSSGMMMAYSHAADMDGIYYTVQPGSYMQGSFTQGMDSYMQGSFTQGMDSYMQGSFTQGMDSYMQGSFMQGMDMLGNEMPGMFMVNSIDLNMLRTLTMKIDNLTAIQEMGDMAPPDVRGAYASYLAALAEGSKRSELRGRPDYAPLFDKLLPAPISNPAYDKDAVAGSVGSFQDFKIWLNVLDHTWKGDTGDEKSNVEGAIEYKTAKTAEALDFTYVPTEQGMFTEGTDTHMPGEFTEGTDTYMPGEFTEGTDTYMPGEFTEGTDTYMPGEFTPGLAMLQANGYTYQVLEDMNKKIAGEKQTLTNIGLQAGFGAFGFNVAHAMYDMPSSYSLVANGDPVATGRMHPNGDMVMVDGKAETIQPMKIMENDNTDYTVTTVGLKYSDGPMSASLGYLITDRDSGMDSNATMLSFSYTLAPGVESRTSIFQGEDDSTEAEGSGFVTGIKIGF